MEARVWTFLFLYGATAIVGLFLTYFWARLAIIRAHQIAHPWHRDRAFVLSTAIASVSGGALLIDGARVVGNAEYGLSSILKRDEAYFIATGLVVCFIGFLIMVWLADLERHPPKWTWLRTMIGVTVLWGVVVTLLAPGVPFNG